ncbi:hypothetical protein [Thermodesulforhabdus norvegica]|uniref:ATP synthase subunit b n=1 Tax=Thermodesulforhabdus norvegica TaxID=39841 RepID=A0A1I4RJV9_9BACT|nr:hypothetical protein [Thermodesulforhabdus norvegica]SFM52263.1 F-type H+-transporting ATPase subunit b [Thermodesulforhabdus norvegica]
MISLNATIFVQVGLFLILMFLLNKKMFQPIHQLMMEREEFIRQKEAELERLDEELRRLEKEYEERLQKAAREAVALRERYKQEGREILRDTMTSVQEEVAAIRQRVQAEVNQELARAREELRTLAETLSYDLTEKILGRRV